MLKYHLSAMYFVLRGVYTSRSKSMAQNWRDRKLRGKNIDEFCKRGTTLNIKR